MAKKKDVYHVKPLTEGKKNIIASLIDEYDIETADDIRDALRDLLGGTIQSMMEAGWIITLDMKVTNVVVMITTVMELRKKECEVIMGNLNLMSYRIDKAALNQLSC